MNTTFVRLNHGWNAEPNAPDARVELDGSDLLLSFFMNPFLYPQFEEEDRGTIRFKNCWRFRFGPPNDEGWWRGQCRFSDIAPAWGEFYMVEGDLHLEGAPQPMEELAPEPPMSKHYLFYLRDDTFECDAEGWTLSVQSLGGIPRKVENEA